MGFFFPVEHNFHENHVSHLYGHYGLWSRSELHGKKRGLDVSGGVGVVVGFDIVRKSLEDWVLIRAWAGKEKLIAFRLVTILRQSRVRL